MGKSEDGLGVSSNENIDIKNQITHHNSTNNEQKVEHTYVEMESSSTDDANNTTDDLLLNTSIGGVVDNGNDNETTQVSPGDDTAVNSQTLLSGVEQSDKPTSQGTPTHKRSNQLEYIQRIVLRALWKHPQSWPFREPVDPVKDNAQDYYNIIKNPMDLGTIRSKLFNGRYETADECIDDFRLIFKNCYTYNSEGLMIRGMCECVEACFNEKIKNLPPLSTTPMDFTAEKDTSINSGDTSSKNASVGSKKRHKDGGSSVRTPSKKKKLQPTTTAQSSNKTVASTSKSDQTTTKTPEKKVSIVDHTCRRDSRKTPIVNGSKSHTPSHNRHLSFNFFAHTSNIPTTSTSAALKYCLSMVRELFTKKHSDYAWPFYDPVDSKSLQLLDYENVIHYPMDLNSVLKNLEGGKYLTAFECVTDLRRMIANSCRYNPPEHIVSQAGQRLIVAVELLIAKAPPEVYDFLVVAPCSIIVPKIDALPEAVSGAVSMCKPSHAPSRGGGGGGVTSHEANNQSKFPTKSKTKKTKQERSYVSDEEDYDDDFVDPITSKAQHGGGFVNVEMNHAEPMTYEEKRKLSLEINRMPTEKLGDIIAFLSELESDIFKEKNQSEVEIDFDNMKPETLRSLEKYVKYLNKPQKTRKKKPSANAASSSTHHNTSNNENRLKNSFQNNSSKLPPSPITNISNPLFSTIKKPTTFTDNTKKPNSFPSACGKFQVVSSLPLSEESDYSEGENKDESDNTKVLNSSQKSTIATAVSLINGNSSLSSIAKAHSNISASKSSSLLNSTAAASIKSTTSASVASSSVGSTSALNKLTFDTVDLSLLPSSLLDTSKNSEISSSDLINEAKATVKQQKLANFNTLNTPTAITPSNNTAGSNSDNDKSQTCTPVDQSNSSGESPSATGGARLSNKHAMSLLTSSNSIVGDTCTTKPEIRDDTNAPRAPSSHEERERMKQEARQRRLAIASTKQPNKISTDIVTSFDEKL